MKRVLVVGDKSVANTGFATYKRELLTRLYSLDKYHLGEYAFCGNDDEMDKVPWDYIPCVPTKGKEDEKHFQQSPNMNKNGRWRWEAAVLHWKPDVVLSVQDPWQVDYIAYSPLRDFYSLAIAAPVDSHPQRDRYIQIYNAADVVAPYTGYAEEVLKNAGLENLSSPIPMGVDLEAFKPMDKVQAREHLCIPHKDALIIGMVARNQYRKRIPELMEAFRDFLFKSGKNAYLYLHTTYREINPWDLVRNLLDNSLIHNVLFSYECQETGKIFASTFKDQNCVSPFTNKVTARFLDIGDAPDATELNKVYNAMDLYVQFANAEGFCVPIIEAAATNTPIVGVNYSAYAEVIKEVGGQVLNPLTLEEDIGVGAKRAIMPTADLVNFLENAELKGEGGRKNVEEKYTWDICVDKWVEIIDGLEPYMSITDQPARIIQPPEMSGKISPEGLVNKFGKLFPNAWGVMHLNNLSNLAQGKMHPQQLAEFYMHQINQFNQLEGLRVNNPPKPYWIPE